EVGVHHLVAAAAAAILRGAAAAWRGTGIAAARRAALLRLVHRLADLHRSLRQGLGPGADLAHILAGGRGLEVADRRLDRLALGGPDLVAALLVRPLGGVDERLGLVPRLDQLAPLLVLLGVELGVLHHLVDVGVGEPARRL